METKTGKLEILVNYYAQNLASSPEITMNDILERVECDLKSISLGHDSKTRTSRKSRR